MVTTTSLTSSHPVLSIHVFSDASLSLSPLLVKLDSHILAGPRRLAHVICNKGEKLSLRTQMIMHHLNCLKIDVSERDESASVATKNASRYKRPGVNCIPSQLCVIAENKLITVLWIKRRSRRSMNRFCAVSATSILISFGMKVKL